MKTLAFILSLIISGIIANAQDNEGITIKVTIDNVLGNEGYILTALHTQDTFLKGPGIQNHKNEATPGSIILVFENVLPGIYAISTMHDANKNYQMDYEDSGMPKEKYALSSNEMIMGPPTFQDVKFEVISEDLELKLRF